jgi:hypothetical protein
VDQSVSPMSHRQQTREQLETELENLSAAMHAGIWERKAACALLDVAAPLRVLS